MTFAQYLVEKKIDATAFQKGDAQLYAQWEKEFEALHPNSFTMQKLNLINPIRRKYQLPLASPAESQESPVASPQQPSAARAVMRPKPKMN